MVAFACCCNALNPGQLGFPFVEPSMSWAEVIDAFNANADGLPVVMRPGTYVADESLPLESGVHIIGGPGVVVESTMPLTPAFAEFVFWKFLGTGAVAALVTTAPTLGSNQLVVDASIAVGSRVWVGQTAPQQYLAQQYWVRAVAGVGPFTLTLDRAIQFPFAVGTEVRPITDPTENIIIEGNGMQITGHGDRAVEFIGAFKCHISGLRIHDDAGDLFGAGVSLDLGGLDSSVRDVTVEHALGVAAHGILLESCEHCDASECRVSGGSVGLILYDDVDCDFFECSASSCYTGAGLLMSSNLMTVGCRTCRVYGGSFAACTTGNSTGILVGYATDCTIEKASAAGNFVGIDTGTVAVRLKLDQCRTEKNTNRAWIVAAQGTRLVAPSSVDDVTTIAVRHSCFIDEPNLLNYSSYGIIVEAAADASTVLEVRGGRLSSNQTGTDDVYLGAGTSFLLDGVRFDHTGLLANQTAVRHAAGGPCIIKNCAGSQASGDNGYVGAAGVTLRVDGETRFVFTAPFTINAAGFYNIGNLVSGGAGAAQAVAWPALRVNDTVSFERSVNAGAPGISPLVVLTPGVGFAATFPAGDTSTYTWRVS